MVHLRRSWKSISSNAGMLPVLWEELGPREGECALDIGMGDKAYSAKAAMEKGLDVVGIDINPSCGEFSRKLGVPVAICDAAELPFRDGAFDYSLAVFSLHEMDPHQHTSVLSEMRRVSPTVVLLEPLLRVHGIGEEMDLLWREAMESAGKFEIYQPSEYWEKMLGGMAPSDLSALRLDVGGDVTESSVDDLHKMMTEYFQKEGVEGRYLVELGRLAKRMRSEGMPRSDVLLLVARFG